MHNLFRLKSTGPKRGFTLLEVLLVIAIIAILAAIVIIAINPGKQLADARNAQRRSDVNTILNGVYQYTIDNNGNLPATITTTVTNVCSTTGATCTAALLIDLGVLTTLQKYLTAMPHDPKTFVAPNTHYSIVKSANGRITVAAPDAEGVVITVTR